jgi:hypothetical protein
MRKKGNEIDGDVVKSAIEASKTAPDPDFAKKMTGNIHSDEEAPQTESISTEYMESLIAQKIDY